MENNRKIALFIAGLVFAGTFVAVFFPKEAGRNADALVRIGAGADISGILMDETAEELGREYTVSGELESSSFQDC